MPRVGRLSCPELGTFDASSWAPLMLELGTPLMLRVGYELGTFDASSWAPLMLRVGHLMPRVGHLSSWAPLMLLEPRVGHLSCLELGASWV